MKQKTALFILLGIMVTAGAIAFFWFRSRTNRPALPTLNNTTPTTILPPAFPTGVTTQQPVYFFTTTPTGAPPTSMPLFQSATLASLVDEMGRVAQSLKFAGAPKSFVGAATTSYQWTDGSRSLFISTSPSSVAFQQSIEPSSVVSQSLPQLQGVVTQFMQQHKLTPTGASLSFLSADYLFPIDNSAAESSPPEKATVVRLRFRYTIDTTPVYAGFAELPSVEAEITSGGIAKLTAAWIPSLKKLSTTTTIIGPEAAAGRLASGEGTIIHIEHPISDPYNTLGNRFTLNQITVTDTSLGYFYDETGKTLSPIYVFRGKTPAKPQESVVTVIISALP